MLSKKVNENMEERTDDALVGRAKKGDVEAFTELARRFQEKIYYTVFGMTRNHQDADDLTQETFLYAYKALRSFKQKSSFYTWIYRIAVNLTLNFLKRKSREKGREEFADHLSPFHKSEYAAFSPEGGSLKKELSEKINEALDSLPLAYKASFNLVVFQGLSHGQAAEALGCSENTVSWRMHKARKILQARLRPYLEEEHHGL
ncbi:MAG: sigma-70 family RNA polymerase sigma factor [Candidatus Aminicenantales bacterium]